MFRFNIKIRQRRKFVFLMLYVLNINIDVFNSYIRFYIVNQAQLFRKNNEIYIKTLTF